MEKFIIEIITDANIGPFVVIGGILAGMILTLIILHLNIQAKMSNRIDERIINVMREDGYNFDRDNK